jgi:hypothetical protein
MRRCVRCPTAAVRCAASAMVVGRKAVALIRRAAAKVAMLKCFTFISVAPLFPREQRAKPKTGLAVLTVRPPHTIAMTM